MKEKHISRVSLEANPGRQRKSIWGMKNEEFMADFVLISRRNLTPYEYMVFKYHFLLGADWKLCCRKMRIDRGTFFHDIYRIQQKLGRMFRELEPYGLFPLDEYFNGTPRQREAAPSSCATNTEVLANRKNVLKFPIKQAA